MGKKTLTVLMEKSKKNSNTGCFSFPQIYPQVAVVCVSKAFLSVLSGRIMRSLSLSQTLSLFLTILSQSDFMQIKEELVQLKAFVWEEPLPIHSQRCCNQRDERERRECVITYYNLSSLVKMATQGRVQTLLFTLHTAHHLIILLTAPEHC